MQTIYFTIKLSRAEFLRFYQGRVKSIQAKAEDGRNIRFPAKLLQPYVSHTGVEGRFKMLFNGEKCEALEGV